MYDKTKKLINRHKRRVLYIYSYNIIILCVWITADKNDIKSFKLLLDRKVIVKKSLF